jgi:branched-chain amino acid aminotransferase
MMGGMPAGSVLTFEILDASLGRVARSASLADASAALPTGAYTTLRTYGGRRVLRLGQHLRRLEESVALQGRPASIVVESARRGLSLALDEVANPESRLRLTFAPPRLFVSVEAFVPLPARLYEEGVACRTLEVRREQPHAKDTRFIQTARSAYDLLPPGVEEGLILGDDAAILEGLSSNFFAIVAETLRTEEERALSGVTRSLVLEVARRLLPVDLRAVRRDDLPGIEEAFLTSVSREVLPVVKIDDRDVGRGRVGTTTRELQRGFARLVAEEAEEL